jgi:transcriptional regulator with XRE-family HTH domain
MFDMVTTDQRQQTLGQWIVAKRGARRGPYGRKMTQQELADLAGCSKSYISLLERDGVHSLTGRPVRPEPEVLDRIASALSRNYKEALQYSAEARLLAGYAPSPASPERVPGGMPLYEPFAEDGGLNDEFLGHLGRVYRGLPPGRARDEWKRKLRAEAEAEAELIRRLVEGGSP